MSVLHPGLPSYFLGKPATIVFNKRKKKEWKVTITFFNQHSYERSLIIIALSTLELQSVFQTLTNESRIQGGKAWSSSILSFPTVMRFKLGLLQLQEQQKLEVSVAEDKEDSSIVLGSLYTGFWILFGFQELSILFYRKRKTESTWSGDCVKAVKCPV